MVKRMYVLHDRKAGVFNNPMMFLSDGEATRALGDLARSKENIVGQHPDDFDLYYVGCMDMNTGRIEVSPDKLLIMSAIQAI